MQIKIKKWGNSQGICFSKEFLKEAGFALNETLDARIIGDQIVLSRAFHHRSLKERAAEYGGQLRLSEELSLSTPEGSEVW